MCIVNKKKRESVITLQKYYHILAYTDKHNPRYRIGIVLLSCICFCESGSFLEQMTIAKCYKFNCLKTTKISF